MSKLGETRPYRVRYAWTAARDGSTPGPRGAETFSDLDSAESFCETLHRNADAAGIEVSVRREYPPAGAVGDVVVDADGRTIVVLPFEMGIVVADGKAGELTAFVPSDRLRRYDGPDAAEIATIGRTAWAWRNRRKRPVDADAPRTRSDNWPTASIAPSGRRYYS